MCLFRTKVAGGILHTSSYASQLLPLFFLFKVFLKSVNIVELLSILMKLAADLFFLSMLLGFSCLFLMREALFVIAMPCRVLH